MTTKQYLLILTLLIMLVGCSSDEPKPQYEENQYQRFLSQQADKDLDKEVDRYEL